MATLLDEDTFPISVVRTIIVTPEDPDSDQSMHQYAHARLLTTLDNAGTFYFQRVSNNALTGFEDPPPGFGELAGKRAGWWRWDATDNGELRLSAQGETSPIRVRVFDVLNGAWTQVLNAVSTETDDQGYFLNHTTTMTAGHSYYVRVSNDGTDAGVQYYQLSGHAHALSAPVEAPAMIVEPVMADDIQSNDPQDLTQHQYVNAVQIFPGTDGSFVTSAATGTFTKPEIAPPGLENSLTGFHAAWWYLIAPSTGTLHFNAAGDGGSDVDITVIDGSFWQILTDVVGLGYGQADVDENQIVYIRVADHSSGYQQNITLSGVAPVPPVDSVPTPPITVHIAIAEPGVRNLTSNAPPLVVEVYTPTAQVHGDIDIVDAPPAVVEVTLTPPSTHAGDIAAPPISAGAGVLPADIRRIRYGIIDPPDVSVLPVAAPTLSGYVNVYEGNVDDPGDIVAEFEYGVGTGTSYMQLGVLSEPVEIYTSYSLAEVTLPALPAGTIYYWRMRIIVDGDPRAYTVWWSFAVGETLESVLPVDSTITGSATYPHLWFIDPPVAAPGESVTLVGYGFPADETGVTFGSDTLQITSWDHIAATAAATTAGRLITPGQIDPAHDEITVIVPDTEEAGSPVTVMGEDD